MKKYLAKFSNETLYEDHFWAGNSIIPNVSLIADTGEVKYNYLEHPNVNLFDILYSDSSGNLSTSSSVLAASEGLIPIGLCVVPSGFFFPNEPARFMALKYGSLSTPDSGSLSIEYIRWGYNNLLLGTELPFIYGYENSVYNATDTPFYDSENHTFSWNNESGFTYEGHADNPLYVYPWDRDGDTDPCISLYDADSNWNINPYIYTWDEENNEDLKSDSLYILRNGAYGDINGKSNTALMLAAYTSENYKTTITSTNYGLYTLGNYPAAGVCWRYSTLGTSQGDWYLGAAGEMAMIGTNQGQIRARLYEISQIYPTYCISDIDGNGYWSSSEYSSSGAYSVGLYLSNGFLGDDLKGNIYGVIPLLSW